MSAFFKDLFEDSIRMWILIASCAAIIVGLAAWIVTLNIGLLDTSGMSNTFNWGLLIAVFAFLVGFGAGSQFVASYIVLADKRDLFPYAKVAQSLALAGGAGAGIAILIDLGDPWHIMSILSTPNPASPLTWDMVTLTLFLICAFVGVILIAKESKALKVWMGIAAASALLLQVVEGLLFALIEARAWWHSFVMPIDFVAVAVVCGLAIAAVYLAIKKRDYTASALRHIGWLLAWAIIIHIALLLTDLCIVAIGGTANDAGAIIALGSTWWMYMLEILLPAIAVFLVYLASKSAGDKGAAAPEKASMFLGWGGALTIIGIFFHRLMLLYPAFKSPTLFVGLSNEVSPEWALPASTGLYNQVGSAFEIALGYMPNFMEWFCTFLPFGVFFFLALVCIAAIEAAHQSKKVD